MVNQVSPTVEEQLAHDFYLQGLERLKLYDYPRAITRFTQAIYIQPHTARYYFERGNAHRDDGNLEAAAEDYASTIRFDPSFTEAYYERGMIRRELFDLAGAIDDFKVFVEQVDGSAAHRRVQVEQSIRDLQQQVRPYAANGRGSGQDSRTGNGTRNGVRRGNGRG